MRSNSFLSQTMWSPELLGDVWCIRALRMHGYRVLNNSVIARIDKITWRARLANYFEDHEACSLYRPMEHDVYRRFISKDTIELGKHSSLICKHLPTSIDDHSEYCAIDEEWYRQLKTRFEAHLEVQYRKVLRDQTPLKRLEPR
jgi:hypothetical protein